MKLLHIDSSILSDDPDRRTISAAAVARLAEGIALGPEPRQKAVDAGPAVAAAL